MLDHPVIVTDDGGKVQIHIRTAMSLNELVDRLVVEITLKFSIQ